MSKIDIKDLSFAYKKGEKNVFSCFNFSLHSGEIIRLNGNNGQGKSTLLKLILGFFNWYSGSITVDNTDIKKMNLGQIGGKIAYLMDNPERQLFALTVEKEKTFIAELTGKKQSERTNDLFEKLNLNKYSKAYPLLLSQGEIQKLAIATLNFDADFFLLDEPTHSLDVQSKEVLKQLLNELIGQNKGILLVSHDTEFLKELSFSEIVLCDKDE